MTKTIGIIGLGSIFPHQLCALSRISNLLKLTAICDLSEEKLETGKKLAIKSLCCKNLAIYSSPRQFFENSNCETIMVATPPHTHYSLVKMSLETGHNTIVEKPAVLHLDEFDELRRLAKEKKLFFQVAYHAAYAPDLIWFANHRVEIEERYSLGELQLIECGFYDPYIIDGCLIDDKGLLGGSYLDSTVNELSVCNILIPLEKYSTKTFSERKMGIPSVTCCSSLVLENLEDSRMPIIRCKTDWTLGLNEKTTTLLYSHGKVFLDHSKQTVSVICDKDDIHLFDNGNEPRLPTHYKNLFVDYIGRYEHLKDNQNESVVIHRILLSNFSGCQYSANP